jgi:RecA-family ATPase
VVALLTELVEVGLAQRQDPDQAIAAIQARVARAVERQGLKAPPAAPLSARALVDDHASPTQPLWLVDRLLPAGGVCLLVGEVASGKTFLALDLAIAVAAGLPVWGQRACLRGRVLYCCLDSSSRTIRGRVQALCDGREIDPPEDLLFDFSALNLAQQAAPGGGRSADQQRLLGMIRATRATLVVLDVLARYLPGVDENAVAAVGPVFSLLRGFAAANPGVTFLVVHHFNKSGGGPGLTGRTRCSG